MKTQINHFDIKTAHGSCHYSIHDPMDSNHIIPSSEEDQNQLSPGKRSSSTISFEGSKKSKHEDLSDVSKFTRNHPTHEEKRFSNQKLTSNSGQDRILLEDMYGYIPETFFIEEDILLKSSNEMDKPPLDNKKDKLQDISLELMMITDSIQQIIDAEYDLKSTHIDTLNGLRKKKRSLIQKKYEIEEGMLTQEFSASANTSSDTLSNSPETVKDEIEKDQTCPTILNIDTSLDAFDISEKDLFDIDIDVVSQKKKVEDSQIDAQSHFTMIPPKDDVQVEQYDPWNVSNSIWAQDDHFEWSAKLFVLNSDVFGHHGYRTNQKEIINAVMSKKDVFVTMPTGGGKSLCYQLPALESKCITVVIEPLISLMEDQVMILKGLNVNAEYLGAEKENEHEIFSDLESSSPQLKLLFITPEKLMLCEKSMNIITSLYQRDLIHLFVVDECHCVSQWGHEFRPQYKKLSILKSQFPNVPLLALTATATPSVKTDILDVLQLRTRKNNLVCFTSSFNRPNLFYEVRKKSYKTIIDDISLFIRQNHPKGSGIIYCLSKPDCENVSRELKRQGFKCDYYHASLSTEERMNVQHRWSSGDLQFICATIAFGMGINKPDVRFVIHHSVPKSLEGFYQESGRAGRDGKPASCVLFITPKDKIRIENLLHQSYRKGNEGEDKIPYQVLKTNLDLAREMVSFCENDVDCRRIQLMEYFGEFQHLTLKCEMCDNCRNHTPIERRDLTPTAQLIIQAIKDLTDLGERKTKATLIDILKGKEKLSSKYGQYSWFGFCRNADVSSLDRLINRMVLEKILEELYSTNIYGVVTSLKLGRKEVIDLILSGVKKLVFGFRTRSPYKNDRRFSRDLSQKQNFNIIDMMTKYSTAIENDHDEGLKTKLITELMNLREQIHKEEQSVSNHKTSIEMLFPTSLISDIAQKLPKTVEDFEAVEGVGKMKAEKYAARFILVLTTFIKENPSILKEEDHSNISKDPFVEEYKTNNPLKENKPYLPPLRFNESSTIADRTKRILEFDKYKFNTNQR